ncbi:MAG TPA: hypothetical protein VNY07_12030 [Chthoniobacterales bacterium]|jgi:hypothetical protein|nr:hypothetical protein [Chthoniobacterales bacterium]
MSVVRLIEEAGRLGLTLCPNGDKVRITPARLCPPEFADELRAHKWQLLVLLGLKFLAVASDVLNETIFFAADEETKAVLIEAGAEPGCVYTREELRLLIDQHRHAPITPAELLHMHTARRLFNGRIASKLRRS